MARKPAEKVEFNEVDSTETTPEKKEEKKKELTHQVAVFYYSFFKIMKDAYFNFKQKDKKGKELPFTFDVSKLKFGEKFLHALNRNIRTTKKAWDRQKEQNDDFLEAFKKKFEIVDEKLSDEVYAEDVQGKFEEYLKIQANKEIQEKLDKEIFEGKIFKIDLKDLEECIMPEDYFDDFERIMVKKEGEDEEKEEPGK